ncbi:MAG: RNA polymerase sigma factor [Deltaproteobacteria bacterium]|nr:RNA polymerase sigma factor [Deltaproteobacteria bacterium]
MRVLTHGDVGHMVDSAALLEGCRQGREEAWRALFNAHFDFVRRVARRLGTPAGELDDVCQDAFWVVFRKIEDFTGGRFTTWLYRITANVVSGRHRRRRFRGKLAELFGRAQQPEPKSPEHQVAQHEAERMVGEILAVMSPKKREVFALYEIEGLSGQEIAEQVGCKLDTVWARLHHARKEFFRIAGKRGLKPGSAP